MAWFSVDIFRRCVEVDLHDYSRRTAILAAREKIKEAYNHGFRYIRLIHGAAGVRHKEDGGSIKFALRSMLRSGELAGWVEERDSKNHKLREWREMPLEEY